MVGESEGQAFLWIDPQLTHINSGEAYGINDNDQVIYSHDQSFFLYQNGVSEKLNGLSNAAGINNSGQIAGANSSIHPVLYSSNGTIDLGITGGSRAINDKGWVVGTGLFAGGYHGFIFDGTVHDLGTLSGTSSSAATAVNSYGDVVGFSDNA